MPDAIAGPLAAAAALLAVAGVQKLRRPEATIDAVRALGLDAPPVSARLLGVVELAVGAGCLAFPSVVALDAALAALYAAFAGFVALLLARGVEDEDLLGPDRGSLYTCTVEPGGDEYVAQVLPNGSFVAAALQSNDEIRGCCVVGPGDEGDVPTVETQKKPD